MRRGSNQRKRITIRVEPALYRELQAMARLETRISAASDKTWRL